ncbi:lipopolysaccharide biosynthesis protein [Massilia sp. TWR1-2-2]|uniref:lipopolysaccharide biosynthesis protein n=1 Tax=Massilia sp. TWR1-2-2 TaxID=2804584 RepID=UPI003CED8871
MEKINNQIAKGAVWMVAFKLIDRGVGLVSTIVLARLLAPVDFGLVAIAMMLIGALALLFAFSFDVHLIQKPDAGRDEFDTAWTFNVIFGTVTALLLAALAHAVALFYHEPRLEAVVYSLALGCFIGGLSNIGPVIFRREMRFDREFKFMLGKRLAPVIVTIPIAIWLHSYWALVIGQLTGTVASVVLSYLVSDYRPKLSLKARVDLFNSSKWLFINNVLIFLNGRASEFVIGKLAGVTGLGVYAISYEFATLPTTELVAPINRAAFPGYSRLSHDIDQLRSSFLGVISVIALFTLPMGIGIAVVADLMVPAVLGWKWLDAIPLIQILSLFSVLTALQTNIGYVYLAVGRPRLITIVAAAQFVVLVALLLPATWKWGATGAAWSFLITAICMVPVNQILIHRQLNLSVLGYAARLWRPTAAVALMTLAVYAVKHQLTLGTQTHTYVLALLLCIAVGALVYSVSLYALWRLSGRPEGAEKECLLRAEQALRKAGLGLKLV